MEAPLAADVAGAVTVRALARRVRYRHPNRHLGRGWKGRNAAVNSAEYRRALGVNAPRIEEDSSRPFAVAGCNGFPRGLETILPPAQKPGLQSVVAPRPSVLRRAGRSVRQMALVRRLANLDPRVSPRELAQLSTGAFG